MIERAVKDLPDPLSPTRPSVLPALKDKEIPSIARKFSMLLPFALGRGIRTSRFSTCNKDSWGEDKEKYLSCNGMEMPEVNRGAESFAA